MLYTSNVVDEPPLVGGMFGDVLSGLGSVAGMFTPGGPLAGLIRRRPGFQDYWNAGIPTE